MISKEVKQKTIAKDVSLKGVGLHTGKEVTLTFKPAPDNNGFSFKRVDLEGSPIIEADANYVTNTQRGTCLEKNGVTIQTSEHVLAALVGMDVDNVIIELDASEPPIMDGSSKFFVEALEKAGIIEQDKFREEYVVKDVISENNIDATIEKIEDIMEIMKFNVMTTPALVIDEVITIKGRVPSKDEVLALLN